MNRSRNSGKKSSRESQNLVTILFILGVIGWGFFAVDRLTESEQKRKSSRIQGHASGHEASWKKSAYDWLTKNLNSDRSERGSKNENVARNIPSSEVPIKAEPEGLHREVDLEKLEIMNPESEVNTAQVPAEKTQRAFLFYRLNSKGQPILSSVKRSIKEDKTDLKTMVSQLIKGPSGREMDGDYIDSFIRKPRILGAGIQGKCAFVDFDVNFGAGVSYQTLRFQIQQIFRNIELWKGVHCLELKVRGRYSPHLGSDGLYFPRRIDSQWLSQNL